MKTHIPQICQDKCYHPQRGEQALSFKKALNDLGRLEQVLSDLG